MKQKTLIESLINKNVCFAVCVNMNSFINSGEERSVKDYFILLHENDARRVRNYSYKASSDYIDLKEKNMTDSQVLEFKNKINLFEKVIHDKNGRVYELKDNSFKKMYKQLTN